MNTIVLEPDGRGSFTFTFSSPRGEMSGRVNVGTEGRPDRRSTADKKELVGLIDGVRESAQSWKELLLDLKRRGLSMPPELAVADGALGFWQAIEEVWPRPISFREVKTVRSPAYGPGFTQSPDRPAPAPKTES